MEHITAFSFCGGESALEAWLLRGGDLGGFGSLHKLVCDVANADVARSRSGWLLLLINIRGDRGGGEHKSMTVVFSGPTKITSSSSTTRVSDPLFTGDVLFLS